jgi:signal peptidase II
MSSLKRLLLVVLVLVSGVGCDQAAKAVARSVLPESGAWSFLGDTVRLELVQNPGAFLSLGASLPEGWREAIFLVGGGGMLLGLLGYVLFSRSLSRVATVGLALILAGGVGNLVDRLRYGGVVVDFLNVGIGPLRTGIFNVADMAILVGVLVVVGGRRRRGVGDSEPRSIPG